MEIEAAWHPDPVGRHEYRWWDGSQWTDHVADGGVAAIDPLDSAAPAQSEAEAEYPTMDQDPVDGSTRIDAASTDDAAATGSSTWSQPGGTEPLPASDPQAQPYQQPVQQPAQSYQQPSQSYQQPAQSYQQDPSGQVGSWQTGGTQPAAATQPSNGMAVAALVVGVISVLIAWIPFVGLLGGLGGVLALIFGLIGRGKVKNEGAPSKGAATSGIVLGVIALLLSIVATAAVFVLGQQFFGDTIGTFEECLEETGGDQEFCERQLEDDLFSRFGVPN